MFVSAQFWVQPYGTSYTTMCFAWRAYDVALIVGAQNLPTLIEFTVDGVEIGPAKSLQYLRIIVDERTTFQ